MSWVVIDVHINLKKNEKIQKIRVLNRTLVYGCGTAAIVAAVRAPAASILAKSHKVKKNWKKFNLKESKINYKHIYNLN